MVAVGQANLLVVVTIEGKTTILAEVDIKNVDVYSLTKVGCSNAAYRSSRYAIDYCPYHYPS